MGPMRKLAGFHGSNQLYFNTRTAVQVPTVLLRSAPLGWVYVCEDQRAMQHPTALYLMQFFMRLNEVFLQDAAAMMVLHADRAEHPLFGSLQVFATEEFMSFKDAMKQALSTEECPLDASLEKVLPGVHQWHRINNEEMGRLKGSMREMSSQMTAKLEEGFQQMANCFTAISHDSKTELANSFINIGRQLLVEAMGGDSSAVGVTGTRPLATTACYHCGTTTTPSSQSNGRLRRPTWQRPIRHTCLLSYETKT